MNTVNTDIRGSKNTSTSTSTSTTTPAPTPGVKAAPKSGKAAPKVDAKATVAKKNGKTAVDTTKVITVVAKSNPKRAGSKAHARFALYKKGMTVGAAIKAGVWADDLRYDQKKGFITLK